MEEFTTILIENGLKIIDICAAFPAHPNDDVVDTCTQAWLRLRKGWFVGHSEDPEDDEPVEKQRITLYG